MSEHEEDLRRLDSWLSKLTLGQRWALAVGIVEVVLLAAFTLRRLILK
jgi:hypothetical protein